MQLENRSLVLDLVEWVAGAPRPYREVMDAWRTSCPRLAVWEEAVDHDLITRTIGGNGDNLVVVTERGLKLLNEAGRPGARGLSTGAR